MIDFCNFRHGLDPDNHTDVTVSALIDVIQAHWGHNTIRPSADVYPSDADRNAWVDVVDIMTILQMPTCRPSYYLPLLVSSCYQS